MTFKYISSTTFMLGMREDVTKVIFLITDGQQNPTVENGKVLDPVAASQGMYDRGIMIFAIGIGDKVNRKELNGITRDPKRVFVAKHPNELAKSDFVKRIAKDICPAAGTMYTQFSNSSI